MGIFSESDIPESESDNADYSEIDSLLIQKSAALSDLGFLKLVLIKHIDRIRYYGEKPTLEMIEEALFDVNHLIKVLE